jgi:hypothetical protein
MLRFQKKFKTYICIIVNESKLESRIKEIGDAKSQNCII